MGALVPAGMCCGFGSDFGVDGDRASERAPRIRVAVSSVLDNMVLTAARRPAPDACFRVCPERQKEQVNRATPSKETVSIDIFQSTVTVADMAVARKWEFTFRPVSLFVSPCFGATYGKD